MKDKFKNWFIGFIISAIGSVIFFLGAYSIVAFILVITSTGWVALLNLMYLIMCVSGFIKLPQMFVKEIKWWCETERLQSEEILRGKSLPLVGAILNPPLSTKEYKLIRYEIDKLAMWAVVKANNGMEIQWSLGQVQKCSIRYK